MFAASLRARRARLSPADAGDIDQTAAAPTAAEAAKRDAKTTRPTPAKAASTKSSSEAAAAAPTTAKAAADDEKARVSYLETEAEAEAAFAAEAGADDERPSLRAAQKAADARITEHTRTEKTHPAALSVSSDGAEVVHTAAWDSRGVTSSLSGILGHTPARP